MEPKQQRDRDNVEDEKDRARDEEEPEHRRAMIHSAL